MVVKTRTWRKAAVGLSGLLLIGALVIVLSFGIAWGIRSLWKSELDEAVNDMGPIALQTYISLCQEVWERKYGGGKKND